MKTKESGKINKLLDICPRAEKAIKHEGEGEGESKCNWCESFHDPQMPRKMTEGNRDQRKNWDHRDQSIVMIS